MKRQELGEKVAYRLPPVDRRQNTITIPHSQTTKVEGRTSRSAERRRSLYKRTRVNGGRAEGGQRQRAGEAAKKPNAAPRNAEKNFSEKYEKPIDKGGRLWYNPYDGQSVHQNQISFFGGQTMYFVIKIRTTAAVNLDKASKAARRLRREADKAAAVHAAALRAKLPADAIDAAAVKAAETAEKARAAETAAAEAASNPAARLFFTVSRSVDGETAAQTSARFRTEAEAALHTLCPSLACVHSISRMVNVYAEAEAEAEADKAAARLRCGETSAVRGRAALTAAAQIARAVARTMASGQGTPRQWEIEREAARFMAEAARRGQYIDSTEEAAGCQWEDMAAEAAAAIVEAMPAARQTAATEAEAVSAVYASAYKAVNAYCVSMGTKKADAAAPLSLSDIEEAEAEGEAEGEAAALRAASYAAAVKADGEAEEAEEAAARGKKIRAALSAAAPLLTSRQLAIMEKLSAGMTMAEAAAVIGVHPSTAREHAAAAASVLSVVLSEAAPDVASVYRLTAFADAVKAAEEKANEKADRAAAARAKTAARKKARAARAAETAARAVSARRAAEADRAALSTEAARAVVASVLSALPRKAAAAAAALASAPSIRAAAASAGLSVGTMGEHAGKIRAALSAALRAAAEAADTDAALAAEAARRAMLTADGTRFPAASARLTAADYVRAMNGKTGAEREAAETAAAEAEAAAEAAETAEAAAYAAAEAAEAAARRCYDKAAALRAAAEAAARRPLSDLMA